MSRAFVRENDEALPELPERRISAHPNYVTRSGLQQLEATIATLEAERQSARERGDQPALARIARDLRYFMERRSSARVVEPPNAPDSVRFGVRVVLRLSDGEERSFRLVGEDEADPTQGSISWVSPLARSLMGLELGEECTFHDAPAEIVRLES